MDPVRFSRLKMMALSPEHYRAAASKQTTAMERGSAFHSLVLGGARVLAYPGKVRRGKEWDAFKADNPDALILTETEHGKTASMAAAVQRNKLAMACLEGAHEKEINWAYLGRSCASHVDVVGGKFVTELKSCAIGQPERFARNAVRMGYHAQLAFYADAVRFAGLGDPQEAYVVAVESFAPYVVTVLKLTERALDQGRRLCRLWFERLLACEAADSWPGYCESIVPLDVADDDVEFTFGATGEVMPTSEEVPF